MLPGAQDTDKKEFLADVSSFANTVGGDLIFGMAEAQGLPTGIVGITSADLDLELRRMDSLLASGLDPRVRYATKVVNCGGGVNVLLIRVEKSWASPHRVTLKGHDKFYARNSAGKYPLDVGELRSAFLLSASINERVRAFRADRIISIANNDTPVPLSPEAKLILHCIPMESFAGQAQFDILRYHRNPAKLRPIDASGRDCRIDLDGVVTFSGGDPATSYTQVYRTGIIESVTAGTLHWETGGRIVIPSTSFERVLLEHYGVCTQVLSDLGVTAPIVIAVTLIGEKGFEMGVDSFRLGIRGHKITKDPLIVPESVVDDLTASPASVLRPLIDLVWNACGYIRSPNFDQGGQWVAPR